MNWNLFKNKLDRHLTPGIAGGKGSPSNSLHLRVLYVSSTIRELFTPVGKSAERG